jgi:transcriptional antiterminator RfaH
MGACRTVQWFALKTQPRRELQVSAILAHRGVEAFFPLIPARPRRDRSGVVTEALFPGYVFSRLALGTSDWIATRSAPGVAYLLGAGGIPSPLPDALIEGIRAHVDNRMREGWTSAFKRGDRVVVEGGPFKGLEAVFDDVLSPAGRVRVLLQIVNRQVPVVLDVGLIERAGGASSVHDAPGSNRLLQSSGHA